MAKKRVGAATPCRGWLGAWDLGWGSVLLGVVWAAWHLPLFYLQGTDVTGQPFLPYLLSVTAVSVTMAAVYWRTRGSLLLCMLLHAATNNMSAIVPPSTPYATDPLALHASVMAWLTVVAVWAGAAGFLVWMQRARPDLRQSGSLP